MLSRKIRSFLPRKLICGARAAHILLHLRGQTHTNRDGNCVDAKGDPILWMTYPAIDFLESLDLSACRVFEYGSGGSTLFWLKRCASIVSVEHFSPWYRKMMRYVDERLNMVEEINLASYPETIRRYGSFDLVVIDGAERGRCAQEAIKHLNKGGMIIFDNAEWYPNTCTFLRKNGFTQIDFCGFSPLNSFTEMTSVFFRDRLDFPYKAKSPHWTPIGGHPLSFSPPDDLEEA